MIYDTIVSRQPIDKGWSGDRKYHIVTESGTSYLLRIADHQRSDHFCRCFEHMQDAAALNIPMCRPIELGKCEEGVYAIQSWIEGQDAEELIPTFSRQQQYTYGVDAGHILKKLHTLSAPQDASAWELRFNAKIDRKIAMYEKCPLKYENGDAFLNFIAQNRKLLKNRPQFYQHGDYHIGNMMVDQDGKLIIIDFDRDDYGDPWEEFNRIVWCAQASPEFASGMVDGYFGGEVPMEFWDLLALYIASNTLSSLPWAVAYGEREIGAMRRQAAQVLVWYDNMKNTVPTWYDKP